MTPTCVTGLNTESPGSAAAGARMSVDLTLADPDGSEPVTVLAEDDVSLTARIVRGDPDHRRVR